jgi:hypothetical protein
MPVCGHGPAVNGQIFLKNILPLSGFAFFERLKNPQSACITAGSLFEIQTWINFSPLSRLFYDF